MTEEPRMRSAWASDAGPPTKKPVRKCEFERAYLELIGHLSTPDTHGVCSHEPPGILTAPSPPRGRLRMRSATAIYVTCMRPSRRSGR